MGILDLWLPILVTTVVLQVASTLIWVVFKYHNADYKQLADEESARTALRGNAPGYYIVPYCMDQSEMKNPEVVKKFEDGPLAYITMAKNGMPNMGPMIGMMFVYFLVIAVLCAYVVSRTVAPEADYLTVFRIAGTVCFVACSFAVVPESIWFARPWGMTVKNFIDALIYGLLAGGIFGWLF